jgi:GT2 family glycosyltransferase
MAAAAEPRPSVSVVIPVKNGAAALPTCLSAVAAQRDVSDVEVIVVDNGSGDDTVGVAQAHPVVSRVVSEERPGSYAARNAGLAVARASVLAFTDADCTPEPTWLAAALTALDATGVDLVGGGISMRASTHPSLWERYDRAVYLRQKDVVTKSGWAVTANLVVRRAVFDAVGDFDATLLSGGDREFCLRAGRAGFRIVYAPDAVVGHEPRKSAREIWQLNRRIGAGFAVLHKRGEVPPWWRMREHWMKLDWVIHLISLDGGPRPRRRQVLPVHGLAMAGRLYGRLRGT